MFIRRIKPENISIQIVVASRYAYMKLKYIYLLEFAYLPLSQVAAFHFKDFCSNKILFEVRKRSSTNFKYYYILTKILIKSA